MLLNSFKKTHYGWYVVAAGTLCIFASLGFGRFALGMLLPAMAESLNLTYSQMGLISTSNFVGYMFAVLFCGYISAKTGSSLKATCKKEPSTPLKDATQSIALQTSPESSQTQGRSVDCKAPHAHCMAASERLIESRHHYLPQLLSSNKAHNV